MCLAGALTATGALAAADVQAPADRLTVSSTFMGPQKRGLKEVEGEVQVNGQHIGSEGKDADIVTGKNGSFQMRRNNDALA